MVSVLSEGRVIEALPCTVNARQGRLRNGVLILIRAVWAP
jgi:hypothetical protein